MLTQVNALQCTRKFTFKTRYFTSNNFTSPPPVSRNGEYTEYRLQRTVSAAKVKFYNVYKIYQVYNLVLLRVYENPIFQRKISSFMQFPVLYIDISFGFTFTRYYPLLVKLYLVL